MVTRQELETAFRVHGRVYDFIKWLRHARQKDILRFDEHHTALNEFDAAKRWLARNETAIPEDLRVPPAEKDTFVNMLLSFGMTSIGNARMERPSGSYRSFYQQYYPDRCSCRFCSGVIRLIGSRSWATMERDDRRGARVLKLSALRRLVQDAGLPLIEADFDPLLDQRGDFGHELAVWAYGCELVRRCSFDQNQLAYGHIGRGVLVLWRQIASAFRGRQSREFRLDASRVLTARDRLVSAIGKMVSRELEQ